METEPLDALTYIRKGGNHPKTPPGRLAELTSPDRQLRAIATRPNRLSRTSEIEKPFSPDSIAAKIPEEIERNLHETFSKGDRPLRAQSEMATDGPPKSLSYEPLRPSKTKIPKKHPSEGKELHQLSSPLPISGEIANAQAMHQIEELSYFLSVEQKRCAKLIQLCQENGVQIPPSLLEPPVHRKATIVGKAEPRSKNGKLGTKSKRVKTQKTKTAGIEIHDSVGDSGAEQMKPLIEEVKEKIQGSEIAGAILTKNLKRLETLLQLSNRKINVYLNITEREGDVEEEGGIGEQQQEKEGQQVEKGITDQEENNPFSRDRGSLKRAMGAVSLSHRDRSSTAKDRRSFVTPLSLACSLPDMYPFIDLLLSHGASVSTPHSPFSPLHVATYYGTMEVIQLLFNHGADLQEHTRFNIPSNPSPIQLCRARPTKDIIQKQILGFFRAALTISHNEDKKSLSLSKMDLATLPRSVLKCRDLDSLDLSKNRLMTIPPSLCSIRRLKSVDLKGNPLSLVPPLVRDPSNGMKMIHFFRDAESHTPSYHWPYARCFLLGGQKSDRVTITKILSAECARSNEIPLVSSSIDVTELVIPISESHEINMAIFDFDSRSLDHQAFRFYFGDATLYLLVYDLNSADPLQELEGWLSHLSECVTNPWVVLVGVSFEESQFGQYTAASIQDAYDKDPRIKGRILIRGKSKEYMLELLKQIQMYCAKQPSLKKEIPPSFLLLSHYIRSLRSGAMLEAVAPQLSLEPHPSVLEWDEYLKLAEAAHIHPKQLAEVTRLLNFSGIICSPELGEDGSLLVDLDLALASVEGVSEMSDTIRGFGGVISGKELLDYLKDFGWQARFCVLRLMEKYGFLYRLGSTGIYCEYLPEPSLYDLERSSSPTIEIDEQLEGEKKVGSPPDDRRREREKSMVRQKKLQGLGHCPPKQIRSPERVPASQPNISPPTVRSYSPPNPCAKKDSLASRRESSFRSPQLIRQKKANPISQMRRCIAEQKGVEEGGVLSSKMGSPSKRRKYEKVLIFLEVEKAKFSIRVGLRVSKKATIKELLKLADAKRGISISDDDSICVTIKNSLDPIDFSTPVSELPSSNLVVRSIVEVKFCQGYVFLPTSLPLVTPPEFMTDLSSLCLTGYHEYRREYTFHFHETFMGRLLSRIVSHSKLYFTGTHQRGVLVYFKPTEEYGEIRYDPTKLLIVKVLSKQDKELMSLLMFFIDMVLESYKIVEYNIFVPCLHCLDQGFFPLTKFPFSEILAAMTSSTQMVMCRNRPVALSYLVPDVICPGKRLDGTLSNGEMVGEGGFAKVYRGTLNESTTVAIKKVGKKKAPPEEREFSERDFFEKIIEDVSLDGISLSKTSDTFSHVENQNLTSIRHRNRDILSTSQNLLRESGVNPTPPITRKNYMLFFREVQIMSRIVKHQNIVYFYGIPQPLSLVMEFVTGGDLQSVLDLRPRVILLQSHTSDRGVLPEGVEMILVHEKEVTEEWGENRIVEKDGVRYRIPIAIPYRVTRPPVSSDSLTWKIRSKIVIEIAKGMQHLHSCDPPIVHKDLRTPNVCVLSLDPSQPVSIQIMDFGLSDFASVRPRVRLCTWQWLAPELQKVAEKDIDTPFFDKSCDVFSFGIVLNEIASRRCPFIDDYWDDHCTPDRLNWRSPFACREKIIHEHLRPVIPPETPAQYQGLTQECWAKDPFVRPSFSTIVSQLESMMPSIANAIPPSISIGDNTPKEENSSAGWVVKPSSKSSGGGSPPRSPTGALSNYRNTPFVSSRQKHRLSHASKGDLLSPVKKRPKRKSFSRSCDPPSFLECGASMKSSSPRKGRPGTLDHHFSAIVMLPSPHRSRALAGMKRTLWIGTSLGNLLSFPAFQSRNESLKNVGFCLGGVQDIFPLESKENHLEESSPRGNHNHNFFSSPSLSSLSSLKSTIAPSKSFLSKESSTPFGSSFCLCLSMNGVVSLWNVQGGRFLQQQSLMSDDMAAAILLSDVPLSFLLQGDFFSNDQKAKIRTETKSKERKLDETIFVSLTKSGLVGIWSVNPFSSSFIRLLGQHQLPSAGYSLTYTLHEDEDQDYLRVWVGSEECIYCLKITCLSDLTSIHHQTLKLSGGGNVTFLKATTDYSQIWSGSEKVEDICVWNAHQLQLTSRIMPNLGRIGSIVLTKNFLWIASVVGGLAVYRIRDQERVATLQFGALGHTVVSGCSETERDRPEAVFFLTEMGQLSSWTIKKGPVGFEVLPMEQSVIPMIEESRILQSLSLESRASNFSHLPRKQSLL